MKRFGIAVLPAIAAFLFAACGGGGGASSGDTTGEDTAPVVVSLQTPLGLQGTRGLGEDVAISYHLRDREFDPANIDVQYGIDRDGDGEIREDEFSAATPGEGGDGTSSLPASPGNGASHLFVWNCAADIATGRHVTSDYVYTETGRIAVDEHGDPIFRTAPGVLLRIRPLTAEHVGAWAYTKAFDVNNNNVPAVRTIGLRIPPEGEDDGTVNEQVQVDIRTVDPDADSVTLAVDWVPVSDSIELGDLTQQELEALPWQPATSGSTGDGTADLSASPAGTAHVFAWDSVADAGTVRYRTLIRFRAVDAKGEVSDWTVLPVIFDLDNYTVFNDPAARLSRSVAGSRATLLADGSVLVTGGRDAAGAVSDAWLFFPGSSQTTGGAIVKLSGMTAARAGHSATRLADGRVLIAGGTGTDGSALASAEIYDPSDRSFTAVADGLGTARADAAAVLLRNGDVLLAGGRGAAALDSSEVFDAKAGGFTSGPGLANGARAGAQAVLLPDGRVLVAGGEGPNGALASIEIYDPLTGIFAVTDVDSDLAAAGRGMALTPTLDPVFAAVATGGGANGPLDRIERFDAKQDRWVASGATLREPRAGHAALLLGDGTILVAGGRRDASGAPATTAGIYDPAADTVTVPNGEPLTAVADAAAAVLANGRAVLFGGEAAGLRTDRLQVFTPADGFNTAPTLQVRTPSDLEPWAFGVRVYWRGVDAEKDPLRIQPEFLLKNGDSDDSGKVDSSRKDRWLPATMKARTVLGEKSSGLTALSSRAEATDPAVDPIDAPEVDEGEHLFLWDIAKDLPRGDYDNVYVRLTAFGASQGGTAQTLRFSVTRNAPVIVRLDAPLTTSGHVVVPYWLQDSDQGDLANVDFQYGIDANGDGRIVTADGESWSSATHAAVSVTVGGTSYADDGSTGLVSGSEDPDPNNDYTDANDIPWGKKHFFVWDSVRDLGAPATSRSDLVLRASPEDYAPSDPTTTLPGIAGERSGFTLVKDPDGLFLDSFAPVVAGADATGEYLFAGVKTDEPLVFGFSAPVDPTSVTKQAIRVTRVGTGDLVSGFFAVDNSSGKGVVTFYPQAPEIPVRADVLAESTGYRLEVRGFDPADPTRDAVKRLGAADADTNARYLLLTSTTEKAFRTGTGVLADSSAPSFSALPWPAGSTDVATDAKIKIVFDDRIAPGSLVDGSLVVVAKAFNGVETIVPGTFELANVVDASGPGGALREYAEVVFTPSLGLPAGLVTIEVRAKTGLTDLAGNALSSAVTSTFVTRAATGTVGGSVVESFDDATRRDGDLTTAFWGTTDPDDKGSASGSGVAGKLTGMYDVGDGSDGTLDFSKGDVTIDTDVKAAWNLKELVVPKGRTLVIKGSKAVDLRVQGDVEILGTIDAAGRDGGNILFYDFFLAAADRSGDGAPGGRGGPGGGDGGSVGKYTWKMSKMVDGSDGKPGVGATTSGAGTAGSGGLDDANGSNYYGAGGGGAAHAADGADGGLGYYTYNHTKGVGGSQYGAVDLSKGFEAGSGGGAGGSVVLNDADSSWDRYGFASGGGGGGGGGALRITSGGRLRLAGTGRILASGGDGGNTIPYVLDSDIYYTSGSSVSNRSTNPGGGGGGSGGSVHLRGGGELILHGEIDVRGGAGGIGYDYYYKSGSQQRGDTRGGDGGDGRIRIEGPTAPDLAKAAKIRGAATMVATTAIDGGDGKVDWKITTDAKVDTDTGKGAPDGVFSGGRFLVRDFEISSGATLSLSGRRPFELLSSGNVKIEGKIDASGQDGDKADQTSYFSSTSGYKPYVSAEGGDGGPGGAKGGDNGFTTSYQPSPLGGHDGEGVDGAEGGKGAGEGGGPGKAFSYTSGSSTYYYYYFSGSGGGGGSLLPGEDGRVLMRYTSYGRAGDPGKGGAAIADSLALDGAGLTGGAGGGAGSNGGYQSSSGTKYGYGDGSAGGGGGGAIRIVTDGKLTLSGTIDVSGGDGGEATNSSSSRAPHPGAGGGGGGGNVLLLADDGFDLGSFVIDASGGAGGVSHYDYESSSYDYGDNVYSRGGDGGLGGVVFAGATEPALLNGGNLLTGKGTATTGSFRNTNTAVSKWQDSGAVAPKFLSASFSGAATADLYVMGAQTSLATGEADAGAATGWIPASQVGDLSGYRWFRFQVVLTGSTVSGKYPEVDEVKVAWESAQ